MTCMMIRHHVWPGLARAYGLAICGLVHPQLIIVSLLCSVRPWCKAYVYDVYVTSLQNQKRDIL